MKKLTGPHILQIIGGVAIMSALTGPKPAGPATFAFYYGCLVGGAVLVAAGGLVTMLSPKKPIAEEISPAARFKKEQLAKKRKKVRPAAPSLPARARR